MNYLINWIEAKSLWRPICTLAMMSIMSTLVQMTRCKDVKKCTSDGLEATLLMSVFYLNCIISFYWVLIWGAIYSAFNDGQISGINILLDEYMSNVKAAFLQLG